MRTGEQRRGFGAIVALRAAALVLVSSGGILLGGKSSALPFNKDMVHTQTLRTGSIMRPLPPGSVPIGAPLNEVATKEEAETLSNPVPATEFSVETGKRLFRINCYPCHGDIAAVPYTMGPVTKFVPGPNLGEGEYYTTMSAGRMYGTMVFGGMALMPRVGWKLSSEEMWHIVNYVRFAQQEVQKQKGTAAEAQQP